EGARRFRRSGLGEGGRHRLADDHPVAGRQIERGDRGGQRRVRQDEMTPEHAVGIGDHVTRAVAAGGSRRTHRTHEASDARGAGRADVALGTLRTDWTRNPRRARGTLRTDWTRNAGQALGALRTDGAGHSLRTVVTLRSLRTVTSRRSEGANRPDVALRTLP